MTKKSSITLRVDAARLVHGVLHNGQSIRELLPEVLARHKPEDKAWLHEVAYGVLRQLPLLQFWLGKLLAKPLKSKFKPIEALLYVGLYQIAFSRVPSHAAVSETVSACQAMKAQGLKGLVNGVLRNFIRQAWFDKTDAITPFARQAQLLSGLPEWLYQRLQRAYGSDDRLASIVAGMQSRPDLWIRVNPQRVDTETFFTAAEQQGVSLNQVGPVTLRARGVKDVQALPGYEEGWFSIQDGAAQLAADYLAPQKGERILDACAAPGGKTGHIIETVAGEAEVVAIDTDPTRLARVLENLDRLGHHATLVCADAADTPAWWDGEPFDRILLDAPCSATGVIRRHPDIKWLRRDEDIDTLVALQQQLLSALWPLLKPGGTLLYATCSILPDENDQQLARLLQTTPDARLVPLREQGEAVTRQILPDEGGMDGFFYARLQKSA